MLEVTSARVAALSILAPRFAQSSVESALPLSTFQKEGADRIRQILATHGLALLCDSVGLGKTFTAAAILEAARSQGQRVCLVIPASLRRMWRSSLRELADGSRGVVLVSHTALGLGRVPAGNFDLVIVDEAHAFRNPKTRRYRALRDLVSSGNLLLVTATPINNSLSDLYFLLRLHGPDNLLRELGVASLAGALRSPEPRAGELDRIRRALIVRRLRADVQSAPDERFRFPKAVNVVAARYDLPLPVRELRDRLQRLSFVGYQVAKPNRQFSPELLRFALLKRFESSQHAIARTLDRQIRFYGQLTTSFASGRVLSPQLFRSLFESSDGAVQLVLEDVTLDVASRQAQALAHEAERELLELRSWRNALPAGDAKLLALRELLAQRGGSAKTIVFTEYRDTARYLWQSLRRRFAVGLIDGQGAWIGDARARRQDVVDRFAPFANAARVHPREAVSVLVATDVLAEGMNLQDADVVVSYDLPWNPVRLIQRIGRVDRIGSPHDSVTVHNFIPDQEFDSFLGLARTLRTKLATVRSTIGLERPVLEPDEEFELRFQRLARGEQESIARVNGSETELRSRFEPPPVLAGIPCGTIAGSRSPRVLVGMSRGSDWEVLVFDGGTGMVRVPAHPDEYLLRALDSHEALPVDESLVQSAIQKCLAEVHARRSMYRNAEGSVLAAAAERVRSVVSELPFETPELYTQAEAVLRRLQSAHAPAIEAAVQRVLLDKHAAVSVFLARLARALRRKEAASEPPEWHVTGVLVVD